MEEQLDTYTDAGFRNAANIYTNGGHSKSYAVLQLTSSLTETIQEGTLIQGSNDAGDVVTGEAYEDALSGTKTLKFRYVVGSSQENYSECQVGGLQDTNTAGCTLTDACDVYCLPTPLTLYVIRYIHLLSQVLRQMER
jgi:hypothetical protein